MSDSGTQKDVMVFLVVFAATYREVQLWLSKNLR